MVEKRQVRIWPSAVRRMREHWPQNISVTGAMMPISPSAPSANSYFQAVPLPPPPEARAAEIRYSVVVANSFGSVTSQVATLSVTLPPARVQVTSITTKAM